MAILASHAGTGFDSCCVAEIVTVLRDYRRKTSPDLQTREALSRLKNHAIAAGDRPLAKGLWCLQSIACAQDAYLGSYGDLQRQRYYGAWKELESAQLALRALDRHFRDSDDRFGLAFIHRIVRQLQQLYPYRYFISPAFLKREERCSICKQIRKPRHDCGHAIGEIYDGEMCHSVVTKAELVEVSIVDNPVQKYSVLFTPNAKYNYAAVAYLSSALASPWDDWSVDEQVRREVLPQFMGVARHSICPCGSQLPFDDCCFSRSFEEYPHFHFFFSVAPPPGTPPNLVGLEAYGIDDEAGYRPMREEAAPAS